MKKGLILLSFWAVLLGICLALILFILEDLPPIQQLEKFSPSSTTRLYTEDGELLGEFFTERRIPREIGDLPSHLVEAVLTTEDHRFYQHFGIDLKGVVRALLSNLRAGRYKEGGSTITQQLAKVLFLSPERTLRRKLKEALLALQIERRYTKEEILQLYLNQVYFGRGAFGVEAAANTFFGKGAGELEIGESALLAAMIRSPRIYCPDKHPEKVRQRRDGIIARMERAGIITVREARKAILADLGVKEPKGGEFLAPYFVDYIREQLLEIVGENLLYKGGLKIYTSLNSRMQRAAGRALREGLESMGRGEPPQGALLALCPRTGRIKALVGGKDYRTSQYNRAVGARRQPGSAFKPIIYATAIGRGLNQSYPLWDTPIGFKNPDGGVWQPTNYTDDYRGRVTLREALVHSLNVPTVKLLREVGVGEVIKYAQRMGINSPLRGELTLALGASEVTLLELTSVYGLLANGGVRVKPWAIERVIDNGGRDIWEGRPEMEEALSPEVCYIVTDMLRGVLREGTGREAGKLSFPVAGKTGTTDGFQDAWFIGYNPKLVAGVWVGYDDNRSLGEGATGARVALPIWIDFFSQAVDGEPVDFFPPADIVFCKIDPLTGRLAGPFSSKVADVAYRRGNQPEEPSPREVRAFLTGAPSLKLFFPDWKLSD